MGTLVPEGISRCTCVCVDSAEYRYILPEVTHWLLTVPLSAAMVLEPPAWIWQVHYVAHSRS